jgi:hypothetical membrane protein
MTVRRDICLLFGPVSAVIFWAGVAGLAAMVPGYSHVHQTVSEIGEMGSPARVAFAALLCGVAVCNLVFAWGVREQALQARRAQWPAYVIGSMAVSSAGIGLFAFPHPLHNVFGLSELIGYQAPLAVAVVWGGAPRSQALTAFSWILYLLLMLAIALNLGTLDRQSALWAYEKPIYGLVQRSLFLAWFAWCAGAGWLMWRRARGH